jgi:hypothetical protein
MFLAHLDTVKLLYRSQFAHLRGRLRLDVSSRRLPTNPTSRLNLRYAGEAVGERLIRVLRGCAADSATLAKSYNYECNQFDKNVMPHCPDSDGRLQLMPDGQHFELFAVYRIDQDFGLDSFCRAYGDAHRSLARDFAHWVSQTKEASEVYGFFRGIESVLIDCYRNQPELPKHQIMSDYSHDHAESFYIPPHLDDDRVDGANDDTSSGKSIY